MNNKTIYIVSGVKRAGTSMVMQMLEKGGLEVVVDEVRAPDEFNPNGYYQHKTIVGINLKSPTTYPSAFFEEIIGKCIKVYAGYLPFIPLENFNYKIVFIERAIEDVWTSRKKMEKRQLGNDKTIFFAVQQRERMRNVIEVTKKWNVDKPNVDMIYIHHKDILENPIEQAKKIKTFLEYDLDEEKMAAAVDPALHREKGDKLILKTDRSPVAVAQLIDKYAADKIYCEIGIGEGHNLNAVSTPKRKFGIELKPYGVQRCKKLYPHLDVKLGNFLNLYKRYGFDVCFLWIVYPRCKKIVNTVFEKNENAIVLMGLNYYYHLPDGNEKKNMYINAYPKQAEADKWNQYIDEHLAELTTKQFQYKIEQVEDDNGEIFSVAVIQKKT